jgi:hypothetical protein
VKPIVLVALGWKYQGKVATLKVNAMIMIVNSTVEDSVTPADCREFLRRSDLPAQHLILAGEHHGMTDGGALSAVFKV